MLNKKRATLPDERLYRSLISFYYYYTAMINTLDKNSIRTAPSRVKNIYYDGLKIMDALEKAYQKGDELQILLCKNKLRAMRQYLQEKGFAV